MSALADVQPWVLVAAALTGYLVGSVNPAALIARARGVDLQTGGSGNPGATNAARLMGRRTGILVAVLDIAKGLIPALLFARAGVAAAEIAGFMAVVGHITSPFLHGHGGKGVATTLGAVLGVQPVWVVFLLTGFALGFALSRRVGIGAVVGAVVLIGCGALASSWDTRVFGIALGLLVLVRHRRNVAAAWQDWRGAGS